MVLPNRDKYLVNCNNVFFQTNIFEGVYDSLSSCNLFITDVVDQNNLQCSNPYFFDIKMYNGTSLNYEESPTHNIEIKVFDAAGLSSTGAITIFVHDRNDPPLLIRPTAEANSDNDYDRCSYLLAESDICLSARQNCRFGEYTGVSISFSDEDTDDILSFRILSQRSRTSGANSMWEMPINQSDIFSLQAFGETIQLYNSANEGSQDSLKSLGDYEYLLNISASDGYSLTYILVTIILEEQNFPPVFVNCDAPRAILEYRAKNPVEESPQLITRFIDAYDIELKDSRQNTQEMMQNVRINVIGKSTFGPSTTWPQAISCSECLYSDAGVTQSGHATCCIANLIAVSQSLISIFLINNFITKWW